MNRQCFVCGKAYGSDKEKIPFELYGLSMFTIDEDWEPREGRCYGCYLVFYSDMYGEFWEPAFRVGDMIYTADLVFPKNDPHVEGMDLPF